MSWITPDDQQRWRAGTFDNSYDKLGAHVTDDGTWFAVWAPHADQVSVVGDFNNWNPDADPLTRIDENLWQGKVGHARPGHRYKYRIRNGYYQVDKTDPYAFAMEPPTGHETQGLAAIVSKLDYEWQDKDWMSSRQGPSGMDKPLSIYELHLGSFIHKQMGESLSYREVAEPLADHVQELGFTHVELMPVQEHPYYGSWGYQVLGYYAPTFRYGSPQDFMYLVDTLHQRGLGVLLDWVPGHFASDAQGLVYFDGSTLFEYDDPQMRYHPDWGTYVFDYNKPGVQNFLISNALFWLDKYHIDGLRVDAVASMLYRDYSRDHWSPNMYGGRENLEAIDLLKRTNEQAFTRFPEVLMIAEESTAWPGVSAPTYDDGLGFLYKWNMGWMHDTLEYMSKDPIHRKYHQNDLTFPLVYAFSEHFVLPLSHDEVVHGKGSLWGKMPGDPWQKAANLRLMYAHMVGHPGKKLLFMGAEYGQPTEWSHDHPLPWALKEEPLHKGIHAWLSDLMHLYKEEKALWNDEAGTFEWIDFQDSEASVASYLRKNEDETLIFAYNFTPVPRENYRIGLPKPGVYTEVLNSDAATYGGGDVGNGGRIVADDQGQHGRPASAPLVIPPLGVVVLKWAGEEDDEDQDDA